jgi:hypothetical protein
VDPLAVRSQGRPVEKPEARLSLCGNRALASSGLGQRVRRRVEDQMALLGVQHGECAVTQRLESGPESDDQGRAAGAREQGDVTGSATDSGHGADVTTPVDLQEARRGQLLIGIDRRRRTQDRRCVRYGRQCASHPVAQIQEVGRARPKGIVIGRPVVRNLAVQGGDPGPVRGVARTCRLKNRIDQILVLEQGQLKLQDGRCQVVMRRLAKRLQLRCGQGERRAEHLLLLVRPTDGAGRNPCRALQRDRSDREARRCRDPRQDGAAERVSH